MSQPPPPAKQYGKASRAQPRLRVERRDRRGVIYIIMGAVLVHGLFFIMLSRPIREVVPGSGPATGTVVPPGDFTGAEARVTDAETGERLHIREFTISTKMAEREAVSEVEAVPPSEPVRPVVNR